MAALLPAVLLCCVCLGSVNVPLGDLAADIDEAKRRVDRAFYADLRRVFPDYDRCRAWLKKEGPVLLAQVKK